MIFQYQLLYEYIFVVFSNSAEKFLYGFTKTKQPATSSLNNALRLVDRLGSFLEKSHEQPSVNVIQHGLLESQVTEVTHGVAL